MKDQGLKLVLFEDDTANEMMLKGLFARNCQYIHVILQIARTMEEAEKIAKTKGCFGADAAVIDGNLKPGTHNNADGGQIAAWVTEAAPTVVRIGIPGFDVVEGAHYNCPKVGSILNLLNLLDNLVQV